jgi:head-tail adaptor
MLPSTILNQLRTTVNRWLTETATIERQTESRGVYGEQVHDWETVASGVACRVINAGNSNAGNNQQFGNQELMMDRYKIVMPTGTVVDVDYRITVAGRVYDVVAIVDDRTDSTDVQAIVSRVR